MKRAVVLAFLLVCLGVAPVFAVSYVDLERTTIGEATTDYGFALEFERTNQEWVSVAQDDSLDVDLDDSFSVECWFTTRSKESGFSAMYLGFKDDDGWLLKAQFNGIWGAIITTDNASVVWISDLIWDNIAVIDQWYHAVFIYNGTGLELWRDGILRSSRNDVSGNVDDTNVPFAFQKDQHWGGYYNGSLDEVRIYDRAINQTEIEYSYNSGDGIHEPLNETDLVGWWHLNEGTGNTAYDETAYNNDGTLQNSPTWITGYVLAGTTYSPYIPVLEVDPSYVVKLYNSTNGLVCNATADSEGTANMTLPSGYRSTAFEATFRVYDDNATFLYSKWFEDVHGGDTYEIKEETSKGFVLACGVLAAFIILPLGAIIWRYKR